MTETQAQVGGDELTAVGPSRAGSDVSIAAATMHALLVTLPVGALACSVLFDVASHLAQRIEFARPSFWLVTVGLVAGVVAGLVGLVAAARLPHGSPARRLMVRHLAVTDAALALFAVSLVTRRGMLPEQSVGWTSIALSVLGLVLLLLGAGLGAQLAHRHGVRTGLPRSGASQPADQNIG